MPGTEIGYLTMLKLPGDEFVTIELVADQNIDAVELGNGFSHLVIHVESLRTTVDEIARPGCRHRIARDLATGLMARSRPTSARIRRPRDLSWCSGHLSIPTVSRPPTSRRTRRRGESATCDHAPEVAVVVVPRFADANPWRARSGASATSCSPPSSRSRWPPGRRSRAASATTRRTTPSPSSPPSSARTGFVTLHVRREQRATRGRDVRRHRRDHVDDPRRMQRCGEITDDDAHAVARRAPHGHRIDVDPDHERVRMRALQQRGDCPAAGAQIDRGAR